MQQIEELEALRMRAKEEEERSDTFEALQTENSSLKAKVESLEAKVATLEKLLERALKPHRNNKGHVSNVIIQWSSFI